MKTKLITSTSLVVAALVTGSIAQAQELQVRMGEPAHGLTAAELNRFALGKTQFKRQFNAADGLGPIFNDDSCATCHSTPAIGGASNKFVTRFGKAAADAVALGRLLLGHSWAGAMVLRVVAEESERAQGRTGGFVPPLSAKEASLGSTLWMAAVAFGGGAASDEDVEFLRQGRSVLTCGLRSDAMALDLSMQELYADRATRARNQAWTADGCAPRPSGVDSWMLFGDEPTTGARLLGTISELPGVRWVMARIVVHPRFLVELAKERG